MAAKEMTVSIVSFETDQPINPMTDMGALLNDVGSFDVTTKTTYVCSHCGKPWPIKKDGSKLPYKPDLYRECVTIGWLKRDGYCCDATRIDCEGA